MKGRTDVSCGAAATGGSGLSETALSPVLDGLWGALSAGPAYVTSDIGTWRITPPTVMMVTASPGKSSLIVPRIMPPPLRSTRSGGVTVGAAGVVVVAADAALVGSAAAVPAFAATATSAAIVVKGRRCITFLASAGRSVAVNRVRPAGPTIG